MPQQLVPNSRPQLKKVEADAILAKHEVGKYPVKLLGIRGYYKKTMGNPLKNDNGIYDDAIFIVSDKVFIAYNANTDPSVQHPGVATLKPGVHLYRRGDHHIGKPNAYPALRPANKEEKVPVTRDGKDSFGIAINIHKGSTFSTSSEGCQTIYPTQYQEFIDNVYSLMRQHDQLVIPYTLIEY